MTVLASEETWVAADHDGACSGSPFEKETGWCSHSAHWQRKNPPWWKPAFHEGCHGSAAACADEVHGKPPAPARERANYVAAPAYFNLNQACVVVNRALDPFGGFGCYLVGSSLYRKDHRDVDVRFLMSDEGYDRMFRTQIGWLDPLWSLLCASVSLWLSQQSGLPVDFQIQRMTQANEGHDGLRSAIGILYDYPGEKPSLLGVPAMAAVAAALAAPAKQESGEPEEA